MKYAYARSSLLLAVLAAIAAAFMFFAGDWLVTSAEIAAAMGWGLLAAAEYKIVRLQTRLDQQKSEFETKHATHIKEGIELISLRSRCATLADTALGQKREIDLLNRANWRLQSVNHDLSIRLNNQKEPEADREQGPSRPS